MQVDETIAAIASAHDGGGLRGIIRISGPESIACVASVFSATDQVTDQAIDVNSFRAARRVPGTLAVRDPFGPVACDGYLWPTDRSYTRQPTAELHTFGNRSLLNAAVETLCQHGARLAQPGEFTLRAFLAGRIDLAQAEAVLGVIDAVDHRELDVALAQLAGGLSQPLDTLRNTLLNLCADLEAGLDFVEDDIEFISKQQIETELTTALDIMAAAAKQMESRDRAEQLPRVVLHGEANAGKSSLWNVMCDGSSSADAIVTDQAGTTRDYLTGVVDSDGARFTLIDTAGVEHGDADLDRALRSTTDGQASTAELVLLCIDGSRKLTDWEQTELARSSANRLVVLTKSDAAAQPSSQPGISTSIRDKESVNRLIRAISRRLEQLGVESSVVSSTAVRCRESLRLATESIERALGLTVLDAGDELIAVELRTSLEQLGQIVGVIYTDDILDRIFSRFCIGK